MSLSFSTDCDSGVFLLSPFQLAMHLWRKMRKVWLSVSSTFKPHKPKGGKGGGRNDASGLLKLQDDVKMCGYNDVQVMWNLLNTSQIKQIETSAATGTTVSNQSGKYCNKQRHSWMGFFWPNQRTSNSCSSSSSSSSPLCRVN